MNFIVHWPIVVSLKAYSTQLNQRKCGQESHLIVSESTLVDGQNHSKLSPTTTGVPITIHWNSKVGLKDVVIMAKITKWPIVILFPAPKI